MHIETATTLPHLELICFGPPTARVAGQAPPSDVLWRKHLALLVYLALSPNRTRTRDHLLGLLWPEKTQDKARHSLNEATRRLRTGLGVDRIVSRPDGLTLNDAELEVDALRFDELTQRDPDAATALLRGDFLEGFTVDDSPMFEDWLSDRRAHYRSTGASLLIRHGELALARNRFGEARDAGREALGLLPTCELAAQLLMRTAALTGDATDALTGYHRFRERLATDFGEEPSRELTALAERIRSQRWHRATSRHVAPEPPLVGRRGVHDEAFSLVEEGARGNARVLVITGDPGHGKSRLLNECVERLQLSGATVVVARPLESDHDAPWSTLRQLMRAGLADAPGLAGSEPDALGILAALVPELADRFPPVEPRDTGHVAAALAAILRAIADEQPVGIALDDCHFADGSTVGALGEAIRHLRSSPVILMIVAEHAAGSPPRELVRLRSEVGRSIPGNTVQLESLTEGEMRQLIDHLTTWCEDADERDRLARRILFEAQGNPFLAVTLLRDLERTTTLRDDLLSWPPPRATYESPLPDVPAPVRMAILARLSMLDEDARQVLRMASIGGVSLDTGLIGELAEIPEERVEEIVDRLEQARFVAYDGHRFAFAAPVLAEVVRQECLTRGQRQRLRRRAIAILAHRDDLESRVLRAELRARAEPDAEALEEAVAVAKAAMAGGSGRTARRALYAAQRAARACGQDASAAIAELQAKLDQK
jgi:DNA-binding SARP family transcriptional activator